MTEKIHIDKKLFESMKSALKAAKHHIDTSVGIYCTDIKEQAEKIPENLRWVSGDSHDEQMLRDKLDKVMKEIEEVK
jgi:hypothetical protein